MSQIEVILWKRIPNLGTVGDRTFVKAGYARNYLLPQGLASRVTEDNIKAFEAQRAELEKQEQGLLASAKERAGQIQNIRLKKEVKTSVDGKLYGSVTPRDVVTLVHDAGIDITRQQVHLAAGNIHQVGTYEVHLQFHSDVMVTIMLDIVSTNPEYEAETNVKAAKADDTDADTEDETSENVDSASSETEVE